MLELEVPGFEAFDEDAEVFVSVPSTVLRLEHSLVSISKWEMKWKKPFLSEKDKTLEETLDYIRCMTIGQNIDPAVYHGIGSKELEIIQAYIREDHTATTFTNTNSRIGSGVITSEQIYYWMTAYNIPMECQKWNLSRLITLLKIASIENSPKKKMSQRAIMEQNKALNRARRRARGSKG